MYFYIKDDRIVSILDNDDSKITYDFIINKPFDPLVEYAKYNIETKDIDIYTIPVEKQEAIKKELGIPLAPPEIDPVTSEPIYVYVEYPSPHDDEDENKLDTLRLDRIEGDENTEGSMLYNDKISYNKSVDFVRNYIPEGTKPRLIPDVNNKILMRATFNNSLRDDLGIVTIKTDKDIDSILVDSTRLPGRKSLRTNWSTTQCIFPPMSEDTITITAYIKKPPQWGAIIGGKDWSLFNQVSNGKNLVGFYSSWYDFHYIDFTDYANKWIFITIVYKEQDPDNMKFYINCELQNLQKQYSWGNYNKYKFTLGDFVLRLGYMGNSNKSDVYFENLDVHVGELSIDEMKILMNNEIAL